MTVLIFSIIFILFIYIKDFLGDSADKEFVCNAGDLGSILGWEDPLEKGTGTHSSILTWRIPLTTVHGVSMSWTHLRDFHFLYIIFYYLFILEFITMMESSR